MKLEPSKFIPILLSAVAIGISSLSWWEAHQARIMSEEINRPLLSVDTISLEDGGYTKDYNKVVFKVAIRNAGKVAGSLASIKFEPYMSLQVDGCNVSPNQEWSESPQSDLVPGAKASFIRIFGLTTSCEKLTKSYISMRMFATYAEPVSGKQYSQKLDETSELSFEPKPKRVRWEP